MFGSGIFLLAFLGLSTCFFLFAFAVRRAINVAPENPQLKLLPQTVIGETSAQSSLTQRFDRWLGERIWTSGVDWSTSAFSLLVCCTATLVAVAVWMAELHLAVQVGATVCVFVLFFAALSIVRRKRLKQITEQLPSTLDLIARSVRAGESFEGAMEIGASSAKEPLKRELQLSCRQLDMGTPVSAVLNMFVRRVPVVDARIFAHTVSVNRELGGKLALGLEKLAVVIRDREEYRQKVNSITSLARFAIAAISLMGVLVLVYLLLVHPQYLERLVQSELGVSMIVYAVLSEIVGLAWVAITLKGED